jgi:hypothetical protein
MSVGKSLTTLFLRIYAMNQRRWWRNDAARAWWDALLTVEIWIGLPLVTLLVTLWVLAIDLFPQSVGTIGMSRGVELGLLVASWLAVDIPLRKKVSKYRREPIPRTSFDSTADRWKIAVAGAVSFGSSVLITLVAFSLHEALRPH